MVSFASIFFTLLAKHDRNKKSQLLQSINQSTGRNWLDEIKNVIRSHGVINMLAAQSNPYAANLGIPSITKEPLLGNTK